MIEKYLLTAEEQYFFSVENSRPILKLLIEYYKLLRNKDIMDIIKDKHSNHRNIGRFHRLCWMSRMSVIYFLFMRIRYAT